MIVRSTTRQRQVLGFLQKEEEERHSHSREEEEEATSERASHQKQRANEEEEEAAAAAVMDSSSLNSAELQQFIEQEKQKAMLNEMVAKLTDVCWDKCITSTPGSKFSSGESTCLSNCAQRYMDMSMIIMKRFQSMH